MKPLKFIVNILLYVLYHTYPFFLVSPHILDRIYKKTTLPFDRDGGPWFHSVYSQQLYLMTV